MRHEGVKEMKPINIGFIGAGAVAELHVEGVQACPNARLVGFTAKTAEERSKRAEEWGIDAYESVEQLLASPAIDAVFVLSPVENHREHAIAALQAGKHVLIEKPVAGASVDVREIAEEAKKANRVCMPAHNYIYQNEVIRARRQIEEGHLGTICGGWINYLIHHDESVAMRYPGVLRQIITHHLYTLTYLLGKPKKLSAMTSCLSYEKLTREDQASLQLQMKDGALVNLFASFALDDHTSQPWTFMFKVLGTHGGVHYSWRDSVFIKSIGTHAEAFSGYEEGYANEVNHFVNHCIRGGEQPLSTIEDAVHVARLLEAAEYAIANNKIVELEP
jgi:predicted dehydrogenase